MRRKICQYVREFEPAVLDLWLRHHIRCWWIMSGKEYRSSQEAYEDYAKHVRLPVDMIMEAVGRDREVPGELMRDMNLVWNDKTRMYVMRIQRYGYDEPIGEGL